VEEERRVLLHEMVHFAVYLGGGRERGDTAHAAPFLAELERLAALGESWAAEQAARYASEPAT
jgi:hypothetical protein